MNNLMSMLQAIQNNPMQFFAQRGINIPQNIAGDPNAIIQHLMNNGKITQQQYNQANNLIRQMQARMPQQRY